MVKAFFSHSTKDFQLVTTLAKLLNAYEVETYIAERDYQIGKSLSQIIIKNIDTSNYFLVVYIINGKDSHFGNQEIRYWIEKKGYNDLIPLVEKGINPEAFLSDIEYLELNPLNLTLGVVNVILGTS